MAYPYIPPPSLIDRAWDLLAEIAHTERALITLTVDRGERGNITVTFDQAKYEPHADT